jgi:hypothetical protein
MRQEKKTHASKKKADTTRKSDERRHPEFETPSQRRNRDGIGRGPSGSDGSNPKGMGRIQIKKKEKVKARSSKM